MKKIFIRPESLWSFYFEKFQLSERRMVTARHRRVQPFPRLQWVKVGLPKTNCTLRAFRITIKVNHVATPLKKNNNNRSGPVKMGAKYGPSLTSVSPMYPLIFCANDWSYVVIIFKIKKQKMGAYENANSLIFLKLVTGGGSYDKYRKTHEKY